MNKRELTISSKEVKIEQLYREAEFKKNLIEQREKQLNFNESLLIKLDDTVNKFNKYNDILYENTMQLKRFDSELFKRKLEEIFDYIEKLDWENEKRLDDFRRDLQM